MPPVLSVPEAQQMPPELCSPAAQHRPFEQMFVGLAPPLVQSVPPAPTQPPQLVGSVDEFTHRPPQLRSVADEQQAPSMLNWPAAQHAAVVPTVGAVNAVPLAQHSDVSQ